jgi:hypothetical protein
MMEGTRLGALRHALPSSLLHEMSIATHATGREECLKALAAVAFFGRIFFQRSGDVPQMVTQKPQCESIAPQASPIQYKWAILSIPARTIRVVAPPRPRPSPIWAGSFIWAAPVSDNLF